MLARLPSKTNAATSQDAKVEDEVRSEEEDKEASTYCEHGWTAGRVNMDKRAHAREHDGSAWCCCRHASRTQLLLNTTVNVHTEGEDNTDILRTHMSG